MAEQNPTVIIAHLDDEKLRKSIDSLVGYVDEKFKAMTTSTTNAVNTMQQELQKLGSLNAKGVGGAGGGELGITKALQRAKQEAKESSVTFDQMAASMQKATTGNGNKTIFSTMDTEIAILKERLVEAKSQVESFTVMARRGAETGDKGLFVFSTENLHKYEAEVTTLTQKINSLTSQRQALKEMLNPQGDAFKNYVDSLTKANPELAALNAQYKEGKSLLQQQTNEVKRRNQEEQEGIRSAKERAAAQERYSQQLREASAQEKASQKERAVAAMETAKALREAMKAQKDDNIANNTQKSIAGVRELHDVINQMHRTYLKMSEEEKASPIGKSLQQDILLSRQALQEYEKYNRALLGMASRDPIANRDKVDSYTMLSNRVRQLTKEYHAMATAERDSAKGKGVVEKIQLFSRAMSEIQKQMNRPTSLKNALGLDENTLDRIAHKIQQLNAYRGGLNLTDPKQVGEMRTVENEIDRLKKKQDELMGKNHQLMNSNNALARSWNYMKNRLAFYFTVGASTQFVKNLIEVRSQYEMNERALGILIDSAERGTQIFNELSQMSLVSPYTLIELSTAAKQLTAYDIAAKDVVDTTRRLADISAAVGVPVERFTYALGQVKAFGHLTSQDARQFLNTGVPLVKELAKHYTELEGRLVSTADVYDRMKKHAVSYNDVVLVINKMTDEGGKFFDFQAKMADTLKVQLANLTLAWNNMLNDIGESQQGILTGGVGALKELLLQWKNIEKVLTDIAVIIGIVKASQLLLNAAFGKGTLAAVKQNVALKSNSVESYKNILAKRKLTAEQAKWIIATNKGNLALRNAIVEMGILTAAEANAAAGTTKLGLVWRTFTMILSSSKVALESFMASLSAVAPQLAIFAAISATVDLIQTVMQRNEAVERFNETLVRNAKQHADAIKNVLADYKDGFDATSLSLGEQTKHWDRLREEIELNSAAANTFIQALLQEDNMGERVNKATKLLEKLEQAHTLMSLWGSDALNVSEDFKILGIGADGLANDAKDFVKAMNAANGEVENLAELSKSTEGTWRQVLAVMNDIKTISTWDGWNPTKFINPLQYADWFGGFGSDADKEKNKLVDAYKELQSEVRPLAESLANQIVNSSVKDIDQVKEMIAQTINDLAEEQNLSDQAALSARLVLEEEFRNSSIKILRDSVADRQASWDMWMKFLMSRHKAVFGKMGEEEINAEEWAQSKRKKLYEDTFEEFKKFNILAAKDIEDKVNDLNSLQVHIKVFYDEQNQPSWLEKDFKRRLPQSTLDVSQYKSVSELISGEQKAYKEATEELKNLNKAGIQQGDHYWDVKKRADQAKEALEAYNAELEKESKSKKGGTNKDVFGDALAKEVQYISDIQKRFNEYQKIGVDAQQALTLATDEYGKSIIRNNAILQKYGVKTLSSEQLATMPLQKIRDFYQEQLKGANLSAKGIEALEKAIANLNVEITKIDYKRITDGLNNELSKIKDEYELAVELDANPELGGAFADLFGINTDELPQTFGEAFDRANKVAKEKMSELKIDVKDFDLLSTRIQGDDNGMWMGHKLDSEPIQKLIAKQKEWSDMLKKNLTETEKALDDYVKKYGDYSDKIAEIEADRIEKVKRLNDAYYSEELRKRPEYIAKLNAIEQGAAREKQQVDFDDFKNSRYYTQMFENLDHVSSVTIRAMRDRLRDLIDNMNDLTPEQLKQVMQQYEKLEQKLTKRNPFRNLTKDLKEYIKTSKQRRTANKAWADADKEYNAQKKVVATIKEKLEKEKAKGGTNKANYLRLLEELGIQQEILDTLKQEVDEAEKKAQKYNLIKKFALEEAAVTAQMVAGNLTSLGDLRDTLDGFGINLGDDLDAIIDDLGKVGEGINQITSSATSGNVVGVVSGVVKSVGGLGDSIASIFGGGAAKTKRLNREIARSQESVRQLQYAYQRLEREVSKATGTQETWAKRQQIANKEEEMKELQRQMQLEQSKRSKDRDDEAIKQYKETIDGLWYEIQDLKEQIANDLLGSDVKSAAKEFVDTWVDAWKQGETTLDAITSKMNDMIFELIKNAVSAELVQRILQPAYDYVNEITSESSAGGIKVTNSEIKALADLSQQLGVEINDALGAFYGQLEQIDAVSKGLDAQKKLSSLQQGISGVTEETAGALEAITNGISQQCYLQSDLLTQIRDAVVTMDNDVQIATQAQILLQLQQSFAVHMAIQNILEGVLNPSGRAFNVELLS